MRNSEDDQYSISYSTKQRLNYHMRRNLHVKFFSLISFYPTERLFLLYIRYYQGASTPYVLPNQVQCGSEAESLRFHEYTNSTFIVICDVYLYIHYSKIGELHLKMWLLRINSYDYVDDQILFETTKITFFKLINNMFQKTFVMVFIILIYVRIEQQTCIFKQVD